MWVIKNLANDKYYKKLEEHNHKLDAEREEATTFDSQERAISKASILHAELSTLGLGINFKVEEIYDWNLFFDDGSHLTNVDECNWLFNKEGD